MVQTALLIGISAVVAYLVADTAFLRGTKRKPLSVYTFIFGKLVFIIAISYPIYWWLLPLLPTWAQSISILVWVAYTFTYCDGSERFGGRPGTFWGRSKTNTWFPHRLLYVWCRRRINLGVELSNPECKYPKDQKHIFCLHPHGILPFGAIGNFTTEDCLPEGAGTRDLLGGIEWRIVAASFIFYVPVYRDICLGNGICDASRYSSRYILEEMQASDGSKMNLVLCPGGATEALFAANDRHVAYIKTRAGFIKLALETGAALVPVYTFGETSYYGMLKSDNAWINWLRRSFQAVLGISLPLVSNIIPLKTKVQTVIGDPIPVAKIEKPTNQQIQELLDKYVIELVALFDKNKSKYLEDPKARLEIV